MNSIKKIFLNFLLILLFCEFIFQFIFFFGLSHPIIFYNPYCDQKYWDNISKLPKLSSDIEKHNILSYKRKNTYIPNNFNDTKVIDNSSNVILYGSSFFDHKIFKKNLKNKVNLKLINYSLSSYGIDQIYLSYQLTNRNHNEDTVIFGFLLEDIDRVIFSKRDYPKIKYQIKDDRFILNNFPIKQNIPKYKISLLTLDFFRNISDLVLNKFNFRNSLCHIEQKKNIFQKIFQKVKKSTDEKNQKLIVVTFNFLSEFHNNKTWRYDFVKRTLKELNITHIDTFELITKESKQKKVGYEYFFNKEDLHYNNNGFKITLNEIIKQIK